MFSLRYCNFCEIWNKNSSGLVLYDHEMASLFYKKVPHLFVIDFQIRNSELKLSVSVFYLPHKLKKSLNRFEADSSFPSRHFVKVSKHCVGLSCPCHSVGKASEIIAIYHSWQYWCDSFFKYITIPLSFFEDFVKNVISFRSTLGVRKLTA